MLSTMTVDCYDYFFPHVFPSFCGSIDKKAMGTAKCFLNIANVTNCDSGRICDESRHI